MVRPGRYSSGTDLINSICIGMTRKTPAATRKKVRKPKNVRVVRDAICSAARAARMPEVIHPMLATLVDDPFSDLAWIFETKWDGFRSVCL